MGELSCSSISWGPQGHPAQKKFGCPGHKLPPATLVSRDKASPVIMAASQQALPPNILVVSSPICERKNQSHRTLEESQFPDRDRWRDRSPHGLPETQGQFWEWGRDQKGNL